MPKIDSSGMKDIKDMDKFLNICSPSHIPNCLVYAFIFYNQIIQTYATNILAWFNQGLVL